MVAADKGTEVKDAEGQAITETHIGIDGRFVESLVSVACIYDNTALGIAERLKSPLSDVRHKRCCKKYILMGLQFTLVTIQECWNY